MSGNGIDMGVIHQILLEIARVQQEHGRKLDEHGRKLDEHGRKLAEHSREFRDLRHLVGGLRQQVIEYHASVLGHGILISELDQRVRRIEDHLDLPPAA